jgi:glyoxylase-like metal-dependent hydrolase (beta-lactamase superfamily II)
MSGCPLPAPIRVLERGWLCSNNILCFEGDGATLVDSGYVGHAAQTLDLVREALGGRRLGHLVNTHSHSDHIGGNAALQRTFGCEIIIPAGIEEHVAEWDEEALLLGPAAQRGDRFRHDGVLRDGEDFQMGGLVWRALAVPGHDMNALAFHCPEARLLISGDALWQDGFGIVFGELLGRPGALAATRETLAMLTRLDVDTVIPGHGAPFGDYRAALDRAFGRLEAFERDPRRVARNAVKACFTFSLLDLGRLPRAKLADFLASVPLFRNVGRDHLGMSMPELADWLRAELLRAGAIALDGDDIVPTMAA